MKLQAYHSTLKGNVPIPGSKSHTIRMVTLAALAQGTSKLHHPLVSADTMAALEAYSKFGADIETTDNLWTITGTAGRLRAPTDIIDVANSGTTLRFAIGSASLIDGTTTLTGDHQICRRPVGPLLQSLNELGAVCTSENNNNCAPVNIKGPLKGGATSIECVTSQYLSSLLINTPLATHDTIITVPLLNEKPYVDITMRYLDDQNIQYENQNYKKFLVKGNQSYTSFDSRVPADFSSATFFFCAGAILDADLVLEGLDFNDAQGDKAVVDILKEMGADIKIKSDKVYIRKSQLKGIDIDMNAIPDALPALAVTACFASGTTRLYNVAQARLKETDRIAVMACELTKMGAKIEETPDGLIITGSPLHAANLQGHHDHRIVMALSIAAMNCQQPSTITTAEAISVTFPNYVSLMQTLGAKINISDK
ncbi:MAG: 3-phosphoshikimate 1-carboxyvinyltransferase [Phycisphaerae bacterium]|nr:3-phosphoshikimate 1-carboxyvinyltransferase [Phycisphaerae bacterium]